MKFPILRILVFSNKFADLWLYHFYYCICIILNLFMIFVKLIIWKWENLKKALHCALSNLLASLCFFTKSLKFCYRKTIWYFFQLIFATHFIFLSEFWSKIFSSILPILVIHPKGCDKATPIFCFSVFVGKWLNVFAWFFLHRLCDDLNYFLNFCQITT